MTLFDNHTAKFSNRSLGLVGCRPPSFGGDDYIRAKCFEYLQLQPNPMYVDIGACIGKMSMIAALHPDIRVIAFEPYPVALECLRENLELNNLTYRVRVEPYALSDQEGIASLTVPVTNKDGKSGNIGWAHVMPPSQIPSWGGTQIRVEIATRTLDSFGIERIDVMKIDVEGFEHKVVLGGEETIARCRPIIVVETNPKGSHALDLLQSWGYEIFDVYCADVWLRPKEK